MKGHSIFWRHLEIYKYEKLESKYIYFHILMYKYTINGKKNKKKNKFNEAAFIFSIPIF